MNVKELLSCDVKSNKNNDCKMEMSNEDFTCEENLQKKKFKK